MTMQQEGGLDVQISHIHPTVDNRTEALAALYRACLRTLRASS